MEESPITIVDNMTNYIDEVKYDSLNDLSKMRYKLNLLESMIYKLNLYFKDFAFTTDINNLCFTNLLFYAFSFMDMRT